MSEQNKSFLSAKVNPILEKLIVDILMVRPEQIVDFMISWLESTGSKFLLYFIQNEGKIENQFNISPKKQKLKKNETDSEEDEEDEHVPDLMDKSTLVKMNKDKFSRTSVSAEAYGKYNQKGNFQAKNVPKTQEQIKRIQERLEQSFLFSSLEDKDMQVVINAMEEKQFYDGDLIIEQGKDGDDLYLVDQGELYCFRKQKNSNEPVFIKSYGPGEAFGELALLYNAPRAATIKSKGNSILFSLDRQTFNHIVKDAAAKKREQYEAFLSNMELLQEVDPYERMQIADALKSKKYKEGEYIVREGDQGDTFYFIESGDVIATKKTSESQGTQVVYEYKAGDYFGELALLRNAPRAANVIAVTATTLVYLDRSSFKRLIGPLDDILKRNFKRYEKFVPH